MRIAFDAFNTKIFLKKAGNIIDLVDVLDSSTIDAFIDEAIKMQYKFLAVKIDTKLIQSVNAFLEAGFSLVDTQVTFCLKCDQSSISKSNVQENDIIFRKFSKTDIPYIADIAKSSFKIDQYHLDGELDDALCNKYYEQWAVNSCNGFADDLYVLDNGAVIAFITINHIRTDEASIGLAAISPSYQGNGLFGILMSKTLSTLYNQGRTKLYYGTQICNYPVLKTMAKLQGRLINSVYVLHKTIKEPY